MQGFLWREKIGNYKIVFCRPGILLVEKDNKLVLYLASPILCDGHLVRPQDHIACLLPLSSRSHRIR